MTLYFCNFPLRLGLMFSCVHRLVLMDLLGCGLVALLTPLKTRYLLMLFFILFFLLRCRVEVMWFWIACALSSTS